ncbi:MAG: protein kinase [Planctomycetota bacterium]
MIKKVDDCEYGLVDEYLAGTLSEEESSHFESHLSTCEKCRNVLESRSAEPEVWENVRLLLGTNSHGSIDPSSDASEEDSPVRPGFGVLKHLAPTDDPEMLGRLGEYEIGGIVGVGGMGAVLRGFDKSLRRVVAIKVMAPYLAGSGPARTRFQREARAAAAITHDNVIDIYGVSEANGLPFLVMPFARGPSLQKRIDESGPLGVIEVIRIGKQIASGLAAAHEQGLVHRDIKPANILLNEGIERLWITDFGVARAMDDASMTNTGVIAGTPQYMSPEQARGENVDQRSDLFSLGSILYTACTGRPPFRAESAYGVLRRITDTDPRPIREVNSEIPEWICRLIDRLMAKHPSDRFQTAAEVADLLESCLAHIQQPTQIDLPPSVASTLSSPSSSTADAQVVEPTNRDAKPIARSLPVRKIGAFLMLSLVVCFAAGFMVMEATEPDVLTGTWHGERWQNVRFSSTPEAPGWYSGTFEDGRGQRGVLHLEWSRLQRRYNGRWRVGGNESGPITIRNQNEVLRGAISFDAESNADPETPRLRDFSWQQGKERQTKVQAKTSRDHRFVEIRVPQSGILAGIRQDLETLAQVRKGDLLATLAPEQDSAKLQSQLDTKDQEVKMLKKLLAAKIGELDIAERSLQAARVRVSAYRAAKQEVSKAAIAEAQAGLQQMEAAKLKLKAREDELEAAEQSLETKKEVFADGIELVNASAKVALAKKAVDVARRDLQNAKRIAESRAAEQSKLQEAESKIQDAIAHQNAAESEVAKTNTGVVETEAELETAKRQSDAIRQSLNENEKLNIVSPVDGVIDVLESSTVGQKLFEGETLLRIKIKEAASPVGTLK